MRRALLLVLASVQLGVTAEAHGTGAAITWNREISKWVDGGIRRGNNSSMLPKLPDFKPAAPFAVSNDSLRVSGRFTLLRAMILDGLLPERIPAGQSMQVIAVMPGGHVEPLVWRHGYDARHPHPFLFRRPIHLPAGTVIQGVPSNAVIALIAGS